MCIIAIKAKGIPIPGTLQDCWNNNPDGAGYAYYQKGYWYIRKGFLFYEDFERDLLQHVTQKDTAILHFRIATSGDISMGCTHPFPISDSISKLNQTRIKTPFAIAHNGILGKGKGKVSDTQLFVKEVLFPLLPLLLSKDEKIRKMVAFLSEGSKLCLMLENTISKYGKWFEKDGIYYSNTTFQEAIQVRGIFETYSWKKYFPSERNGDREYRISLSQRKSLQEN